MSYCVFSASGRLLLLPHLALAWRLDLMFNQLLAGWRSPLWVMEAEWWWLQTAAHHRCSSVAPLLSDGAFPPCWGFKKKAAKLTDCCRSPADPHRVWTPRGFYSHLGDVLSRAFTLKFPFAKVRARTGGSVFHPFSSSRKEAEEL